MMLLAASRRSDSLGDFDLYVSQKQPAGKWGEPVNLGPEINTAARELSPKLAPNGKYLVWMSCRLPALSPKTPNSDDSPGSQGTACTRQWSLAIPIRSTSLRCQLQDSHSSPTGGTLDEGGILRAVVIDSGSKRGRNSSGQSLRSSKIPIKPNSNCCRGIRERAENAKRKGKGKRHGGGEQRQLPLNPKQRRFRR
jgi:hypothetical protein